MAYGLTKSPTTASPSKYFSVSGGATLAITNNITIEGWFKFSDIGASFDCFPFEKWGGSAATQAWALETFWNSPNYVFVFYTSSGTTVQSVTVNWATPVINTWYHLAVTFASGSTKFYVNGVQMGTTQTFASNTAFNATSSTVTSIGSHTGSAGVNGQISLVRMWSTALSQATISANMCNVFGSAQTNMLGEWSLDNVVTDASGNGLTLTNNGTTPFITDTPSVCAVVAPIPSRAYKVMQGVKRAAFY